MCYKIKISMHHDHINITRVHAKQPHPQHISIYEWMHDELFLQNRLKIKFHIYTHIKSCYFMRTECLKSYLR